MRVVSAQESPRRIGSISRRQAEVGKQNNYRVSSETCPCSGEAIASEAAAGETEARSGFGDSAAMHAQASSGYSRAKS